MKKLRFLFLIVILSLHFQKSFSQSNYDVRNAKWGMTIEEVINSEKPLHGSIEDNELSFYNVDIGNSLTARIIYTFRNGKLNSVKYIVFGYKSSYTKGTCENIIKLSDKVAYTRFIISILKNKSYKCDLGWYFPDTFSCKILGKSGWTNNCSIDNVIISQVDKEANNCNLQRVNINFENDRTDVVFSYNEWHNRMGSIGKSDSLPCDSDFYNILCWITFEPTQNH